MSFSNVNPAPTNVNTNMNNKPLPGNNNVNNHPMDLFDMSSPVMNLNPNMNNNMMNMNQIPMNNQFNNSPNIYSKIPASNSSITKQIEEFPNA